MKCCICNTQIDDPYGHSPWPVKTESREDRCCSKCNVNVVIPARINNYINTTTQNKKDESK